MKPVVIMLDGMDETPIALPFPFEIGEYVIHGPNEWHWFRRYYEKLVEKVERANDNKR